MYLMFTIFKTQTLKWNIILWTFKFKIRLEYKKRLPTYKAETVTLFVDYNQNEVTSQRFDVPCRALSSCKHKQNWKKQIHFLSQFANVGPFFLLVRRIIKKN